MSGDRYHKCINVVAMVILRRSSARTVNTVDGSDTEDRILGNIDTKIKTLNTE